VRVQSLTEFALRLKTAFNQEPLALAPVLTLAIALLAFSGLCQVLRGVGEILVAAFTADRAPPAASNGQGATSRAG
jgi:hypothetical protein